MSDDRLKAVEARVGTIESEQRAHIRFTMQIGIGLAALIATATGLMLTVTLLRTDRLEDRAARLDEKVNALPGQINQNLQSLTQTLSGAITATQGNRPPVIIIPPPQAPHEPPKQ